MTDTGTQAKVTATNTQANMTATNTQANVTVKSVNIQHPAKKWQSFVWSL